MSGENTNMPAQVLSEQIELEKIRDQHSYDFAIKNLEHTVKENQEIRTFLAGNRNAGLIVTGMVILAFFIFFMYALHLGRDTLISDVIKIICGAFGGGGIGYLFGFRRGSATPPK